MKRDYSTGTKTTPIFFVGTEVEHTPAYGLQTLFLARNDLTYDQIKELCVKVDAEAVNAESNTETKEEGEEEVEVMVLL